MARTFDNNVANYMSRGATNLGLNGLTAFSVAAWINLTASSASNQWVSAKDTTGGWRTWFMQFVAAGTTMKLSVNNAALGQFPEWTTTSSLSTGVWTRVLFTFERNAITSADGLVYWNGVSQALSFAAGGYSAAFTLDEISETLWYGVRPGSITEPLNAGLAWVTVWNRRLTADEALVDYNDPRSVTLGRLHNVECNSDTDLSGFGNDMTVTGTLADANYWPTRREGSSVLGMQQAHYPGRGPKSSRVRFYQSPTGFTSRVVKFRKTLSSIGSRTGSRQVHGS